MKAIITHPRFTAIVLYSIGLFACIGLSNSMWHRVTKVVNSSYKTYPLKREETLSSRLNHANTYYSYARYRKNSQPEFEQSFVIAQEILNDITDSLATYPNRADIYQAIKIQSVTLANYCKEQSKVSQLNIASYVPMYLEMMAHDEAFNEQDCDDEEVETRAANRAIDVILDLTSPEKNAKIGERPLFALVRARGESKAIHESIIQKLNAESKFYTISDHEIVKILGPEATYENIFDDSTKLSAIADFFGASSIALIELINNDKVNGIHYYGMRYDVWQPDLNTIKEGVYTEFFLRNRNFNQITIMKIPLFLMFLGMLGVVGFCIALVLSLMKSTGFAWYSLWISLSVAVVTIIGIIDYIYIEFLNPLPSDYYATDAGEIWQISLPISLLILPIFINYIILGRLDKHIRSYQSRLDERSGIFNLLAGSLVAIPLIWTNYRIMRFGIEPEISSSILYALALYLVYGFGLSRWVHKILNFPQKVDGRRQTLAYITVAILTYLTYATTSDLIISASTSLNFIYLAFVAVVPLILEYIYQHIPERNLEVIVLDEIKPVNINELLLSNGKWIFKGKSSSMLLVESSKSLNSATYLLSGTKGSDYEWHVIDFSHRGNNQVHYFPFAKSFEHLFTHKKFNDVAEQSRIIGNLLGKLVSTVSSIGDYLIDESDPKPRKASEVAAMIAQALSHTKYGLIFQHPEFGNEEDIELFDALLALVIVSDEVPPIVFCEGAAYSFQQKFKSVFNKYSSQLDDEHVTFHLNFKNLAQAVVDGRNIEPISRVLIEERLISSELDQSPSLAKQAVDELMSNSQTELNKNNQVKLKSFKFDLSERFNTDNNLSKLNHQLRQILECAAIAANHAGVFNLDLVTAIAGLSRKEVLSHLDNLQNEHIIIDLMEDKNLDLYQFADIDLIKSLRQENEHEKNNLSQQVREYYRAYISFFLPHSDWQSSKSHLEESIKNSLISERELTFLALRVLRVGGIPYISDLINFVLTKTVSEGVTTNFDGAQQLIKGYRKKVNGESVEINWLEFVLSVETGAYNSARTLYESGIRSRAEQGSLSHSKLLVCVRYCFGDFMHSDNANHGRTLNNSILASESASDIERYRAKFYTSKLISNSAKNLNSIDNLQNVNIVITIYEELITSLRTIEVKNSKETIYLNLLKEVLNDYLGFYADSVWPYPSNMAAFKINLENSKLRFNELKTLRLELEKVNLENWLDPSWVKRGTEIDYRGLCYTYNYIQRGYLCIGQHEDSIKVGFMSFTLNSFIGDHTGKQLCAGSLSKAFLETNRPQDAVYWAEQSVAYADIHDLYIINALMTLSKVCAVTNNLNPYISLSKLITQRHTLKHFSEDISSAHKKSLLKSSGALRAAQSDFGSRFYWENPVDFDFLTSLATALQSIKKDQTGLTVSVKGLNIKVDKVLKINNKIEFDLTFPKIIGTTTVIPIDSIHKTESIKRGSSDVFGIRGVDPLETAKCSLIVQNLEEDLPWHIITAHPGNCTPPLPNPAQAIDEHKKSLAFWNNHAFIIK